MSQAMLAEQIGINRATLSKYENGQIEPSVSQLEKIADALGVSLFDLLPVEHHELLKTGWLIGYEDRSDELREATNFGCDELERRKSDPQYFRMLLAYENLNRDGQYRVIEYAEALAVTGNYTPETPPKPLVTLDELGWVTQSNGHQIDNDNTQTTNKKAPGECPEP